MHEDKEFWIYVHDKGEEFYLHYDFWPNVPFIHHSVPNEHFADIEVKKQLEVQNENCDHQSYDYFGMNNYLFYHIILIFRLVGRNTLSTATFSLRRQDEKCSVAALIYD